MHKIYDTAQKALEGLFFDGMTIMAGGFGLCGIRKTLSRLYVIQVWAT